MEKMFCFQCEQTAGGKGCTINGVCGKRGYSQLTRRTYRSVDWSFKSNYWKQE